MQVAVLGGHCVQGVALLPSMAARGGGRSGEARSQGQKGRGARDGQVGWPTRARARGEGCDVTDGPTKPRRKSLPGLSRSDRQFLNCYAKSRTLTEAAYKWAAVRNVPIKTREAAGQMGSRKLIQIRKKIAALGGEENLWEHLGLGLQNVARALSAGMSAEKTIPLMANGKVVAAGPYPDYQTRLTAAMAAARLRGDLDRNPPPAPEPPASFSFTSILPPKEEGKP